MATTVFNSMTGNMNFGLSGMKKTIMAVWSYLYSITSCYLGLGNTLRGYINYLQNSCSSDAVWSKSDLRNKSIEGGFPEDRDVDEHIEQVDST